MGAKVSECRNLAPPQPDDGVRPSPEMEESVAAVEQTLGYSFRNKRLLEEALTHPSRTDHVSNVRNYERLEFLGDAAIGLAISEYLFDAYPQLEPGDLTDLRKANVCTENLARVAVRHNFYRHVRRNVPVLDDMVKEFAEAVSEENENGSIKAPKVLADIVESIAAAVYLDVDYDLQKLWEGYVGAYCYIDRELVAKASDGNRDIAKHKAIELALHKVQQAMAAEDGSSD